MKPEATQKVELVNTPKDLSNELVSRSSTAIAQPSGLVKLAALLANRRRRTSLMMLGLAVLVGITSFPTTSVDTVAVAAESNAKSIESESASDLSVARLRTDVSAMQAKYGHKSSVLIAQSIPTRYVNQASPSSSQFGSEASVTIDVASPKTKAFKAAATGQAAFNQGGYEGESKEYEDRAPSTTTPGTTTLGFSWPAAGKLTSRFGRRWGRMHKGIDIAGPVGTPINAAADGTVISAGWNSGGYGNLVELKHSDGTTTRYGHNSRLSVSVGQTVRQGQQLAEMGSTGHSTGSHVHFEIRPTGGSAVNPIAYLPANG